MGEDWGAIALYMGYKNELDMLNDLYVNKELSSREIAERVGMAQPTVLRRLRLADIKRRPRGGAQSFQRQWYKLHLLDQRWVFLTSLTKVAKTLRVSSSLVYKYKRAMKGDFNGLYADMPDEQVGEVSTNS